jgi:uncharacterized membrane protein YedE/YeeE
MQTLAHLFPTGWFHFLGGGVVIGLGVSLLFGLTGFIGGVSTAYSAVWSWFSTWPHFQSPRLVGTRNWRMFYGAGMILGGLAYLFTGMHGHPFVTAVPRWQLALGGVFAGFGARMGGGCTSGHGICGLGSLQWQSLVAVCVFLATAILTAHGVRAAGGF